MDRADAGIEQNFQSSGSIEDRTLRYVFDDDSATTLARRTAGSFVFVHALEEIKDGALEPVLCHDVQVAGHWINQL